MPNERYSSTYRLKNLPIQAIEARVSKIVNAAKRPATRDSAQQHADEDDLLVDFIAHVATADANTNPELLARKAKAVLKVRDSTHERWCS